MLPRLTRYQRCACAFLCLLAAPSIFSWMNSLLSYEQILLKEMQMAIPQAKFSNKGTMDRIMGVSASLDVLKMQIDRSRHNLTATTTTTKQPTLNQTQNNKVTTNIPKTSYPLTLDSSYYLNSPEVCQGLNPLHLLVIVHTATGNFRRRQRIRETWAGKNLTKTRRQRVVFLLGLTGESTTQRMIEEELDQYGDLVQGRFVDTYHNLTHKGVMGLRWVHEYCPHAQLILKVDDDVFFNLFLFYHIYFPKLRPRNRTIACSVQRKNTSPIHRWKSKWQVEESEFRGYQRYPVKYCSGFVVIITPDIIRALYRAAYTTPFFWVDDVYLFGMLPAKVGHVKYVNMVRTLTTQFRIGLRCYRKTNCTYLASVVQADMKFYKMWNLTLAHIPASLRSEVNRQFLVT